MSAPVIAYIGPKFEEINGGTAVREPSDNSLYGDDIIDVHTCQDLFDDFARAVPLSVDFYHDIRSLLSALTDPKYQVDFIDIDLEYLQDINGSSMFDVIRSLQTILKFTHREAKIVGGVGHDTDPELIRLSLQAPEICTLTMRLGGPWTFDMIVEDVRRYLSGDHRIPAAIRAMIKPSKKTSNAKKSSIVLTPRQTQILDLVTTRGASNKVIARSLKISESTVKLHMSAILKKFGCRNRTQLAVFSQQQSQDKAPV